MLIASRHDAPFKTVAEFVAYAKANPGKVNFGSAGTGGTIHLAGEMFKQIVAVGADAYTMGGKTVGSMLIDRLKVAGS